MSIAYLARLPAKFLRRMAGFQKAEGSYVLPRALYTPPVSLQVQIWPWVDTWLARVRARAQGKGWKAGGLAADDRAAGGFLELLVLLRDVLLQDLAILQKREYLPYYIYTSTNYYIFVDYPELPLFQQPVFAHKDWLPFAQPVQLADTSMASQRPDATLLQQSPATDSCSSL
jgi:hypothetical protein